MRKAFVTKSTNKGCILLGKRRLRLPRKKYEILYEVGTRKKIVCESREEIHVVWDSSWESSEGEFISPENIQVKQKLFQSSRTNGGGGPKERTRARLRERSVVGHPAESKKPMKSSKKGKCELLSN